tara:strand:- start:948 stop:1154 length:207 start_codon:yes stop_codon:yes gene_type:complete
MNPVKNIISMINPNPVFDYSSLAQANKGAGVSAGEASKTQEGIRMLQSQSFTPFVNLARQILSSQVKK